MQCGAVMVVDAGKKGQVDQLSDPPSPLRAAPPTDHPPMEHPPRTLSRSRSMLTVAAIVVLVAIHNLLLAQRGELPRVQRVGGFDAGHAPKGVAAAAGRAALVPAVGEGEGGGDGGRCSGAWVGGCAWESGGAGWWVGGSSSTCR